MKWMVSDSFLHSTIHKPCHKQLFSTRGLLKNKFSIYFSGKTGLRYKFETKYRIATIMEEDALNQPSAAGRDIIFGHKRVFRILSLPWKI